MKLLTAADYYKGRDVKFADALTQEIRDNAIDMVKRANDLLISFGEFRSVNSGWRPPAVNRMVPRAAIRSHHMRGNAIDLDDDDGELDAFCLSHLSILESIGLWLEDPNHTPRWCHVQRVPPGSGRRVFIP